MRHLDSIDQIESAVKAWKRYMMETQWIFIVWTVTSESIFADGNTKESEQLINHIISTCAEHQQLWEPREVRREFLGSIAIAVQRGNASAMFEGYSRAKRAIGNITSAVSPSAG